MRLDSSSTERCGTAWRTATTSSGVWMARVSLSSTAIDLSLLFGDTPAQQVHAALDIQRSAYAGHGQSQLDEGNRDGRAHADDDRLGIEHPRHRGNVAEHPADERVDDLERRDVDQHALGVSRDDP